MAGRAITLIAAAREMTPLTAMAAADLIESAGAMVMSRSQEVRVTKISMVRLMTMNYMNSPKPTVSTEVAAMLERVGIPAATLLPIVNSDVGDHGIVRHTGGNSGPTHGGRIAGVN